MTFEVGATHCQGGRLRALAARVGAGWRVALHRKLDR